MKRARLTREADADITALIDWLIARSPQAAERTFDTLFHAIDLLRDQPELGPVKREDERELPVPFGRFGFVVRYTVSNDAVIIQRVFHGAQQR